jgi:hypothetical protein
LRFENLSTVKILMLLLLFDFLISLSHEMRERS